LRGFFFFFFFCRRPCGIAIVVITCTSKKETITRPIPTRRRVFPFHPNQSYPPPPPASTQHHNVTSSSGPFRVLLPTNYVASLIASLLSIEERSFAVIKAPSSIASRETASQRKKICRKRYPQIETNIFTSPIGTDFRRSRFECQMKAHRIEEGPLTS